VPSLTARVLRAGLAGLASVVALASVATGCLDRPVAPQEPQTTNLVVEKILQEKVDKIDLLFMIDNSISMADKQVILSEAVPQLVSRLVTPILIDGVPEFDPVRDIHIGVISSSIAGHGGNVCANENSATATPNDKGQLMPFVRPGLNSYQGKGFLWWDPDNKGGGESSDAALINDFRAHVTATGEIGCGFEASLESWYRFLIDPEPHTTVTMENNVQVVSGIDEPRCSSVRISPPDPCSSDRPC
jgi:hypothetical protein